MISRILVVALFAALAMASSSSLPKEEKMQQHFFSFLYEAEFYVMLIIPIFAAVCLWLLKSPSASTSSALVPV